ncbi:MAG: amidohydrolase family protein [Actinomycetota bacterium]
MSGSRRLGELWRNRLGKAGQDILERARTGLRMAGGERSSSSGDLGRGIFLVGSVWPGGDAEPFEGTVVIDGRGVIDRMAPLSALSLPADITVLGGPGYWIGPGVVDAHVHLAFGSAAACLAGGVVGVRDLGAPPALARQWRTGHRRPAPGRPFTAVAGPVLTAPRGYPSRTWGRERYAAPVGSAGQARQVVQRVAADGADLIKIALEPGLVGWPVPSPAIVRAVVQAAHAAGLSVVAHALQVDMVRRALDGGVDELAHTPTERLPEQLVDRIAEAGIGVVSTLQTFFSAGSGRSAADNATALHRAGVRLRYGTDLGNEGTRPGVDPRELDRLADTGLGRSGALRAATEYSAGAPGIRRRTGLLRVGEPVALVLLPANPLAEPGAWRSPTAVLADGRLIVT